MSLGSPVIVPTKCNDPVIAHLSIQSKNSLVLVILLAQDDIVGLGKAHTRSTPSLSSLPKVALEIVPLFVWLNKDRSRPRRVECRPQFFSTPLSFRRSVLWCSGPSMFRKLPKPRNTSALPSCRPVTVPTMCNIPILLIPMSGHYNN